MDKLKYIRVQEEDGTYSSDIPLAVDSENVTMLNGHDLQETLGDLNVTNADDVTTQLSSLRSSVNSLNQQKIDKDGADGYIGTYTTQWLNNNVTPTGSVVTIDGSLTISQSAADAKTVGVQNHASHAIAYNNKIEVNQTDKTLILKANSIFYWDGGQITTGNSDITYTQNDIPASVSKIYITANGTLTILPYSDATPIVRTMGFLGFIHKSSFNIFSPVNAFTPIETNKMLSDITADVQFGTRYNIIYGSCFICLCGKTLFIDCYQLKIYDKLTKTHYTPIYNTFVLNGDYSQRFIQYDNGNFSLSPTFNDKAIAFFIKGDMQVYPLINNIIVNRRKPLDGYVRTGHKFHINLQKYKIDNYDAIIGYNDTQLRYSKFGYGLNAGPHYITHNDGNITGFNINTNNSNIDNEKILFIGDSFVARGYIQHFLHEFNNTLTFIGTKQTQNYEYMSEGVSGSRLYYFLDPETSPFIYPDGSYGLGRYLTTNNLSMPDIVIINSAINHGDYYNETYGTYLEQLTTLVNIFTNYSKNIKIYVTHGANYAISQPSNYGEPYYRFATVIKCINSIYDSSLDGKIIRIPIFSALDDELDYTHESTTYFNSTCSILTDCVHPTEGTGFKKIAEQIYNYLGI